jgi:integrase/recombinase XerD
MESISEISANYLKICTNNKKLSKHTLKAYKIDLSQFESCVGSSKSLNQITKVEITKFHDWLLEIELAPASIKRKLACVKAMFRWLELEEILTVNPFNKVRTAVKLPRRLPRNVTASDILNMIKKAKIELGIPMNNMYSIQELSSLTCTKKSLNKLTTILSIELMLCTGMRVSELAGIGIASVNVPDRKIKLFGKGSRERFVYLPDKETCNLVQAYEIARKITEPCTDNFLVNSRGQPASTQFIRKLIREAAQNAYVETRITPHMLRHSAACELIESGLDIRFVQRLLGHSSISTTEIYTHVSDNLLRDKVSQANVRDRIMKK